MIGGEFRVFSLRLLLFDRLLDYTPFLMETWSKDVTIFCLYRTTDRTIAGASTLLTSSHDGEVKTTTATVSKALESCESASRQNSVFKLAPSKV
jgi:hypothetical protein